MNYDISTEEGMRNSMQWTQSMFDSIKDGGAWAVPRSGTVITIDHANKTARLLMGYLPEPDIKKVLTHMGWQVIEITKEDAK